VTSLQHSLQQFASHPARRTIVTVAAVLLSGAGATFALATFAPEPALSPVHIVTENLTLADGVNSARLQGPDLQSMRLFRSDSTRATDTAETLFKRLGVFDTQAAAFLRTDAQSVQSLLGHGGRAVTVQTSGSGELLRLQARWSPDDDGMFKRLSIEKPENGAFQSRLDTVPMTASARLATGTIESSLFAATDAARIPDAVAVQLAEIFSGDIDFHRALRKGDHFSVVYETLEGDGEPLRAGRVLSAEFVNAGKTYQAMWFQEPLGNNAAVSDAAPATHSLGKGGYYSLQGESLKRNFLASPLQFSRVSSGFKMRFHPILQSWHAHLGVDYAAPTGTPVRTVGDGTVEFAGVQNGFGNVVMVRHQGSYATVYAHLSRIFVKAGQSVLQGQNVGAVGATGWATGPHLHFEFRVNGVHRDPLTIARQSEAVPVAAAQRPQFERVASEVRAQLAAATRLRNDDLQ
jgi:murein DD-endopeptidase MepM/ murein hydrolase activator NlpD